MNGFLRVSACASALLAAFLGLNFFQPGLLSELGSEVVHLPQFRNRLREQEEQRDLLQQQCATVIGRVECKRRIVAELIAEHITLPEAAAKFRDLEKSGTDRAYPSSWSCPSTRMGDERFYRGVIAYAREQLHLKPELAATVGARLEMEMLQERECGGIRLAD
jgi:hypothetical protein